MVPVANDLGLGGGVRSYSGFLHYLQLASHEWPQYCINVTKDEIPKTTAATTTTTTTTRAAADEDDNDNDDGDDDVDGSGSQQ